MERADCWVKEPVELPHMRKPSCGDLCVLCVLLIGDDNNGHSDNDDGGGNGNDGLRFSKTQ